MKDLIHRIVMVILLLGMMAGVIYLAWQNLQWKDQAMLSTELAAKLWATSDYSKGKLVKLRLVIEDDPSRVSKDNVVTEGQYVIRNWVGYVDPLLKSSNCPNIQIARMMVEHYNARMREIVQDPESFRKRREKEITYWQANVLENKNDSNQAAQAPAPNVADPDR